MWHRWPSLLILATLSDGNSIASLRNDAWKGVKCCACTACAARHRFELARFTPGRLARLVILPPTHVKHQQQTIAMCSLACGNCLMPGCQHNMRQRTMPFVMLKAWRCCCQKKPSTKIQQIRSISTACPSLMSCSQRVSCWETCYRSVYQLTMAFCFESGFSTLCTWTTSHPPKIQPARSA